MFVGAVEVFQRYRSPRIQLGKILAEDSLVILWMQFLTKCLPYLASSPCSSTGWLEYLLVLVKVGNCGLRSDC